MLINGREKVGIKKLNNRKAFIDHSDTTADVYKKLEDFNPRSKRKVCLSI